ncbi:DEAD/DEAH box helicase [Candidatus Bathycorpusculum sp.]|uniref:DEAD/DEAH box helicase n=1 Tax=Candidatus Bathycorpusculum sp. TaxID=2994959 RepID=UPI0028176183|nr:DEAD/DEAH box helicase [Candidatus Termitimicrobium sp.]MCL2432671.1 DEAD/DEAH box helicase [Candidatus Termitimicrobium sp.]
MSQAKSPFKRVAIKQTQQVDIETLFKDLKNRASEIRDLYAHQADILRAYSDFDKVSDVSLELPTGSGKTLVGLLIAEWRRRTLEQRVLYLCPTKQLAQQVYQQSQQYGLETKLFIGSKRNFNQNDLLQYRSAKVIAISTYSGLFNSDPGLNDPQTIMLDDAHGAESYISSMWSMDINKQKHDELFHKIIALFEKDLSTDIILKSNDVKKSKSALKTEKVPLGIFYQKIDQLKELIDTSAIVKTDTELFFSWENIRKGLHACHIYISSDQILIRPYIPPTLTHKPFANAEQRVYMSATLGQGGELERTTGVCTIKRIPKPRTYLSRGIGRRFFLFPNLTKNEEEHREWLQKRLTSAHKTLVLCPNQYTAGKWLSIINSCEPQPQIFQAKDIEEDLRVFTAAGQSVLVLTNRYDGIDLPHGICRQIILADLPSKTNLQETFLEERLGLDILLRERIKTRIEQAAGRCTRSDTDSAVVIMLGNKLLDFCAKTENKKCFHPEIRAEIQFTFEQESSLGEQDAMLQSFMERDEHWSDAEQNIAALRDSETQPDTKVTNILANTVYDEVNFAYALWNQDFANAVKHGRKVVDGLSENVVSSYSALWSLFVAGAAYVQSKSDNTFEPIALSFLHRAKTSCKMVSWFAHELKFILPEKISIDDASTSQAVQVENILDKLKKLGYTGPKFNNKMSEVEELLKATDATKFESGLVELGKLLGFTSWKPTTKATPDAVWQIESQALLLESKSEEKSTDGISVQTCRQTAGHLNWASTHESLVNVKERYAVLVTPKTYVDKDAMPHVTDIKFLSTTVVLDLFEKIKSALIISRSQIISESNEGTCDILLQSLVELDVTAEKIMAQVVKVNLRDLPTR